MGLINRRAEYDYFEGFLFCAQSACRAAQYLFETLDAFDPAGIEKHVANMHRIEHEADVKKDEIKRRLAREFITPIEREDISALCREIDNIVDAIEDALRRVYMLNIRHMRPEAVEFAKLVVRCTEAFRTVVDQFRNFKKSRTIYDAIRTVGALEEEGDALHLSAMRRLFTEAGGAEERMVWMSIFETLENCMDACEHAAEIVQGVIAKNT